MPDEKSPDNPENSANEPDEVNASPGMGLSSDILAHDLSERKDINLARRAIRERWPMTPEVRIGLVNRLLRIVEKEEIEVMTKMGPHYMEGPADANAVAAAKVLVAIEGQNQADQHLVIKAEDDAAKNQAGDTTINIGMVGNMSLGQEPLTTDHAREQAQAILDRLKERMKPPEPAPVVVKNKLDELSEP